MLQYKKSPTKSKTIHIKRLFRGKASVRDYIINDALLKKLDLILECSGEQMFIPNSLILQLGKRSNVSFKSKFNKQKYTLIDFVFSPKNYLLPNQTELFNQKEEQSLTRFNQAR